MGLPFRVENRKPDLRSPTYSFKNLRDVDWTEELLTIRSSKCGKSRLVPLHPTTKEVLADYASQRNQCSPDHPTAFFFPSNTGARLDEGQVRRVFYRLSRQVGIRGPLASHGPRLHDFRHHADFPIMPTTHRRRRLGGARAVHSVGIIRGFPGRPTVCHQGGIVLV